MFSKRRRNGNQISILSKDTDTFGQCPRLSKFDRTQRFHTQFRGTCILDASKRVPGNMALKGAIPQAGGEDAPAQWLVL